MALTGRIDDIVTAVRRQFNDSAGEFLGIDADVTAGDTRIVEWISRFIAQLAAEDFFRKTTDLTLAAGINSYDLTEEIPDYVSIIKVFNSVHQQLAPLSSYADYQTALLNYNNVTTPAFFYVDANLIYIAPTPLIVEALTVLHSYDPGPVGEIEVPIDPVPEAPPLTETVVIQPPIPTAYDGMLRDAALAEAFELDHTRTNALVMADRYLAKALTLRSKLLAQNVPVAFEMEPYR